MKSDAYIKLARTEGRNESPECLLARAEWETAQQAYISLLNHMESAGIKPGDSVFPLVNNVRAGLRNLMMFFF